MAITGDGSTDDRAALQALIDDSVAAGTWIVEVPWAGQGKYKIGSPGLDLPGRVKLRGQGEFNTALFSDGSHAAINITAGTGQGGEAWDFEIRDMAVTNASTGKAITSAVLCQGYLFNLRTGAGDIAIDLPAQSMQIHGLKVYRDTNFGGLLGSTLLKLTGNDNHVTGLVTNESVRSGWTNGSPLVWITGGGHNSVKGYLETTWGNGQDGFHLKVDGAAAEVDLVLEPHLSGTGAITNNRSVTLTSSASIQGRGLSFLGNNGAIDQGRLYLDATSMAHIDYWAILSSLDNVVEFASASGGRVTGSMLQTSGSSYRNTRQVQFDKYMTSDGIIRSDALKIQQSVG